MRFLFFFFSVLILTNSTLAGNIGIQSTQTQNVLSDYGKVLTDFLVKNLPNTDYYIEGKTYSLIIRPYISWIGTDYNICLELLSNKGYTLKVICNLASTGEDVYPTIKSILKELGNFSLKELPEKKENLIIKTKTKIKYKQYKVESQKGDILLYYKPVILQNEKKENLKGINIGKVIIGLNSIYLSKNQAVQLFKFLLENYKIEQILIKKY